MDLPIRIKSVAVVHDGKIKVIVKSVAWPEVPRQLRPKSMTGRACVHDLSGGQLGQSGIGPALVMMPFLPIHVRLKRPVAGLTTNARLGHVCEIGIRGFVVVLSQSCVVATGAHAVPVHSAPCPMSPLARLSIFLAENIEPFVAVRIKGRFHRLPAATRG